MEALGIRQTPFGPRARRWEQFKRLMPPLRLALRAAGLYQRGARNALDIRLHTVEIASPRLPAAFDGYRLLHLTDPHFDALPGLDRRIAELTRGLAVDLHVMTGDYRRRIRGPHEHVLPSLEMAIGAPVARDGILTTLGNHDTEAMVAPLERLGARVLANETISIERAGAVLHVTGFDDVHYYYTPAADAAARAAPTGFKIALVHSPEFADHAARAGYDLYLCGHTHGGQICAPNGKPVLTASAIGRRFAHGLWRNGEMMGYTSSGAGISGLPVRFFSRGEVTLITLRRACVGDVMP